MEDVRRKCSVGWLHILIRVILDSSDRALVTFKERFCTRSFTFKVVSPPFYTCAEMALAKTEPAPKKRVDKQK